MTLHTIITNQCFIWVFVWNRKKCLILKNAPGNHWNQAPQPYKSSIIIFYEPFWFNLNNYISVLHIRDDVKGMWGVVGFLWNNVKSFNFVGTKFYGLMTTDMFVDTWNRGFQISLNITKLIKYFDAILN